MKSSGRQRHFFLKPFFHITRRMSTVIRSVWNFVSIFRIQITGNNRDDNILAVEAYHPRVISPVGAIASVVQAPL